MGSEHIIIAGRNLRGDFWDDPIHDEPRVYRKTATVLARQLDYDAVVSTPEGEMTLHAGDYLVTDDPITHAWPVRRDVFEATYEETDAG